MPQITSLTGKTPLERLEQSLQTNNDQYSQGRENQFSIGQEMQKRAKDRKEQGVVQGGFQSLLEKAMTPNEKTGEVMDEPTLKREAFRTGLGLILGGGEAGKQAVPILESMVKSFYPDKNSEYSLEKQLSKKEITQDEYVRLKHGDKAEKPPKDERSDWKEGTNPKSGEGEYYDTAKKKWTGVPTPSSGKGGGGKAMTDEELKAAKDIEANSKVATDVGAQLTNLGKGQLKDKTGNPILPDSPDGIALKTSLTARMKNAQEQVHNIQKIMSKKNGWKVSGGESAPETKEVKRTGTHNGKKVTEYTDGTIEYQ